MEKPAQPGCDAEAARLQDLLDAICFPRRSDGIEYGTWHPLPPSKPSSNVLYGGEEALQSKLAELVVSIDRLSARRNCQGGRQAYVVALGLVNVILSRLPECGVEVDRLIGVISRLATLLRDLDEGVHHQALQPSSRAKRPHAHSRVQLEFRLWACVAVECLVMSKKHGVGSAMQVVARRAEPAAKILKLTNANGRLSKSKLTAWRTEWRKRPRQVWTAELLSLAAAEMDAKRNRLNEYVNWLLEFRLSAAHAKLWAP